jgi:hypothetical protein
LTHEIEIFTISQLKFMSEHHVERWPTALHFGHECNLHVSVDLSQERFISKRLECDDLAQADLRSANLIGFSVITGHGEMSLSAYLLIADAEEITRVLDGALFDDQTRFALDEEEHRRITERLWELSEPTDDPIGTEGIDLRGFSLPSLPINFVPSGASLPALSRTAVESLAVPLLRDDDALRDVPRKRERWSPLASFVTRCAGLLESAGAWCVREVTRRRTQPHDAYSHDEETHYAGGRWRR